MKQINNKQDALQAIHERVVKQLKRSRKTNESIQRENWVYTTICKNFDSGPNACAREIEEAYGVSFSGEEVLQIFRKNRMANPVERKELLEWSAKVAGLFHEAVDGDRKSVEAFEKARKEPALKSGKKHNVQDHMALLMIFVQYPEMNQDHDLEKLLDLGNTMSRYLFYDFADIIRELHGFAAYKEAAQKSQSKKMSYAEVVRKIEKLEQENERISHMLEDLQNEFEEQLEESRVKELTDFFIQLNSEKYGHILDALLTLSLEVSRMRKNHFELPIELNGLLIMVKKLIEFIQDSHIEPIMKINTQKRVVAADIEFCDYEGSPFIDREEEKLVEVISPGWIYKEKQLQISRPKIKEVVSKED